MIHIRTMTDADVPLGMRLKEQAGFNQTEADWRRFLSLQPDGCFVAELDGEPVGTVTNCLFDSIGWIAMLLVDKRVRGRGIGTRLTRHALDYLEGRGVRTARLDATPRGRPIYEKLGFVAEYEMVRMEGVAPGHGKGARHLLCEAPEGPFRQKVPDTFSLPRKITPEKLEPVVALDRRVTGTNRRRLIERLYQEEPDAMHVFGDIQSRTIAGYLTSRSGVNAAQIGPGVALTDEAGRALADAALERSAGRAVFVDVPTDNRPAIEWAQSNGLVVQRPFTRMRKGEPVVDQPSHLWASSGPEKG
jgi:ribosomal protein S18 acetylase RimI-like enzyme